MLAERLLQAVLRVFCVALVIAACVAMRQAEAAPLLRGLGGASDFGSVAMGRNDDGSSGVIALGSGFPYGLKLFSGNYTNLYINNNGNLTFKAPLGTFTPTPFPITNLPMLAAFWGDVDTRGGVADPLKNNVYYSTAVPGKLIVTWNYVGYYSGQTNKLNAFQIVLTDRSDVGQGDFDIEYRYEQLQWTTGGASGGSNGLGGTPAQMGFDAGDGKNFYRHPDSQTANILKLTDTSNVNDPGVWRFEVRGGTPTPVKTPNLTNVRLIQTLNTDNIAIDTGSFLVPPYSITPGNGQTAIEWRFDKFPADVTKDLGYDVLFKNPVPNENRLLIAKLELLYDDVNGRPVKTALGSEYVNVYPSIYQIAPVTDKSSYGAGDVVQISSTIKNLSAHTTVAAAKISVVDANNQSVAVLGTGPAQTLVAGGTALVTGLNFSTGDTYVGTYKVVAEVIDTFGQVVAFGVTPFAITGGGATSVKGTISADKQSYNPFETVRLSDRIANLQSNAALNRLAVVTTVINPDGSVRFTHSESLQQLAPRGQKEYSYDLMLGKAAAGQYTATLTVTAPDGAQLAHTSTQFAVRSTADTGAGLVGAITASPELANAGQSITLTFEASNNGNSALAGIPLTVTIVDLDQQQVVSEYPYTANLPIGRTYNGSVTWVAGGSRGTTYVAVLSATVAGKRTTLAQTAFSVLKLDIRQVLSNANRVLVLVSCKDKFNDDGVAENGGALNGTQGAQNDDGTDIERNDEQLADAAPCVTPRSQAIDQVLTALDVPHLITTTETAFKGQLRSSLYNTYWISGKQEKLHGDLAAEIREAVFSGNGLIIDGLHDERNKTFDAVAGIRYHGKIGATDLAVDIPALLFEPQRLGTAGRAVKLEVDGGKPQAAFDRAESGAGPAIVLHQYGAGHTILFAFDLVRSMQAQSEWQPLLARAMQYALPAQATVMVPGALVPVRTSITNLGQPIDVDVISSLPGGALLLASSPTGTYDVSGNAVNWAFNLARAQTKDLFLTLRVPSAAGDFTLRTDVATVINGIANPYGAPFAMPITVVTAAQTSQDVRAALQALAFAQRKDQQLRDALVDDVQDAISYFDKNTAAAYETAITKLVAVAEQLSQLTAVDTSAIRHGIGRMIREAQWRWTQALPSQASTPQDG